MNSGEIEKIRRIFEKCELEDPLTPLVDSYLRVYERLQALLSEGYKKTENNLLKLFESYKITPEKL